MHLSNFLSVLAQTIVAQTPECYALPLEDRILSIDNATRERINCDAKRKGLVRSLVSPSNPSSQSATTIENCPPELRDLIFNELCGEYKAHKDSPTREPELPLYSQVSKSWRESTNKHLPWPYNLHQWVTAYHIKERELSRLRKQGFNSWKAKFKRACGHKMDPVGEDPAPIPLKHYLVYDIYNGDGGYLPAMHIHPSPYQLTLVAAILEHNAEVANEHSCRIVIVIDDLSRQSFLDVQKSTQLEQAQASFIGLVQHLKIRFKYAAVLMVRSAVKGRRVFSSLLTMQSCTYNDIIKYGSVQYDYSQVLRSFKMDLPQSLQHITRQSEYPYQILLLPCMQHTLVSLRNLLNAAYIYDGQSVSVDLDPGALQGLQTREETIIEHLFWLPLPDTFDPTIAVIMQQMEDYRFVFKKVDTEKLSLERVPAADIDAGDESLVHNLNERVLVGRAKLTRGSSRIIFRALE